MTAKMRHIVNRSTQNTSNSTGRGPLCIVQKNNRRDRRRDLLSVLALPLSLILPASRAPSMTTAHGMSIAGDRHAGRFQGVLRAPRAERRRFLQGTFTRRPVHPDRDAPGSVSMIFDSLMGRQSRRAGRHVIRSWRAGVLRADRNSMRFLLRHEARASTTVRSSCRPTSSGVARDAQGKGSSARQQLCDMESVTAEGEHAVAIKSETQPAIAAVRRRLAHLPSKYYATRLFDDRRSTRCSAWRVQDRRSRPAIFPSIVPNYWVRHLRTPGRTTRTRSATNIFGDRAVVTFEASRPASDSSARVNSSSRLWSTGCRSSGSTTKSASCARASRDQRISASRAVLQHASRRPSRTCASRRRPRGCCFDCIWTNATT